MLVIYYKAITCKQTYVRGVSTHTLHNESVLFDSHRNCLKLISCPSGVPEKHLNYFYIDLRPKIASNLARQVILDGRHVTADILHTLQLMITECFNFATQNVIHLAGCLSAYKTRKTPINEGLYIECGHLLSHDTHKTLVLRQS